MQPEEALASAIIADFLGKYLADRQAGLDVGLEEYQRRYPGHADLIAREYESLVAEAHAAPDGSDHAFLRQYARDLRRGKPRSLNDYLALFPEASDSIARHFVPLRDGSALSTVAPGQRIGPYEVIDSIGQGAQGLVCLAEDTRLRRRVALKLVSGLRALSGDSLARFKREAEITSRLDHPGICKVYDAGEADGVSYIVMQWVAGETLARRIQSTKAPALPAASAVMDLARFFEKAARAVHAAHEAGVIHRDIKPGNIMVTPEGEPVLLDFGLARETGATHANLTDTGLVVGTPAYMSPEQLLPDVHVIDQRTDVYSLGVSLFESITGERPFQAPTREGLQRMILNRDPLNPRRLNPAVPRDLGVVVLAAIEKNRDRRYQTALALAEDLRRIRERLPILARSPGPIMRAVRWAQRKPAAALAVALLVAGATIATIFAVQASSNLTEWSRLADGRKLEELIAEDGSLWPAVPSKVAAMKKWLLRANDLAARLPDHEAALQDLRNHAKPRRADSRAVDRQPKGAERIAQLVAARDRIRAALGTLEPSSPRRAEMLRQLDVAESNLRTALPGPDSRSTQETWEFDDPTLQWRHDRLSSLVEDLRQFVSNPAPKPGPRSIEQRIEFATTLRRRTVDDHARAWNEAAGRVASNPKYGGLRLRPQLGLIPLGCDPKSGLEEFYDTATGEPLSRDAATGTIALTENMAMIFVLLPGGTFRMGAQSTDPAQPAYDPEARSDEGPPHQVSLDPFLMSKYEMTQGQWLRFTGHNPAMYNPDLAVGSTDVRPNTLRNPVESLSWEDATSTCFRLGLSLPTEAQWEYACRAGTETPWWCGADKASLRDVANLSDQFDKLHEGPRGYVYEPWDDGYVASAPVGSFLPNGFGLHDVHGNVWEWCQDTHYGRYSDAPPRKGDGLRRPEGSAQFVNRGGSFFDPASHARSSLRSVGLASMGYFMLGVRPARALEP